MQEIIWNGRCGSMFRRRIQHFWWSPWAHASFTKVWSYHIFVMTGQKRNVNKCKTCPRPSVPAVLALIPIFVLVVQVLLSVRVSQILIPQNQIKINMHFFFFNKMTSTEKESSVQNWRPFLIHFTKIHCFKILKLSSLILQISLTINFN